MMPRKEQVQRSAGISALHLGLVFLAMAVLITCTAFLTRAYRAERMARARSFFESGKRLEQQGDEAQAIEQYRNALVIARGSTEYRLALALALVKLQRYEEAEIYLRELLANDPTSGIANLMLARIAAKQGRTESAITWYQRAIYGYWPEDAAQNRIQVRFELLNVLEKTGARKQIIAQLLQLLDLIPEDIEGRLRIAQLLLKYGAPDQSADVFRDLRHQAPRNAVIEAGYGEAEYQLRNYRIARSALQQAVRRDPTDLEAAALLRQVQEILSLDPTLRGLSAEERYRRSLVLVEATSGALEACLTSRKFQPSEQVAQLLDSSKKLLAQRRRPRRFSEAADDAISLAEDLWDARGKLCGAPGAEQRALARVLEELAQ